MKEIDGNFRNWFAGFTAGDGCFSITKKNRDNPCANYRCRFQITLRNDDRPILEEIHETLGIGSIYGKPACLSNDFNHQPTSEFYVTAINDCARLVELFEKYPLRAKKQRDFEVWKQAVTELQKPVNERNPDLLKYYFYEIKETRKYKGRRELTIPKIKKLQLTIEFESTTE